MGQPALCASTSWASRQGPGAAVDFEIACRADIGLAFLVVGPGGGAPPPIPNPGMEMQLTQKPRVHNHHIVGNADAAEDSNYGVADITISHAAANLRAECPRQGQGHHRRPSQAVSGV